MTTRDSGTSLARHVFTVDEFHRMAEAGVLTEEDRVELIEGEVLEMAPIGPEHGGTVNVMTALFGRALGSRALLSVQNPLVLDDHSEPEPDLMLLRPREDCDARAHPRPGDVLLLVEVADESLERDRELKLPRYAAAGVPEVWIVDLAGRRVELCRQPESGAYASRTIRGPGASIAPSVFSDLELAGDDLFPAARA
jgi:Uma2 family endonuclease